jgi:hypothetical protein
MYLVSFILSIEIIQTHEHINIYMYNSKCKQYKNAAIYILHYLYNAVFTKQRKSNLIKI